MKSWKTTLCGVLGAVAAAITLVAMPLLDNDPNTNPNWVAMGAALATAVGLVFAKDHSADAVPASPAAPAMPAEPASPANSAPAGNAAASAHE